jgi:hypothetical protein
LTLFALMASIDGMLSNLFAWLDASPVHYWFVAWSTFSFVVVLGVIAACFRCERSWWQHRALFATAMLLVVMAFRWPVLLDNRQYEDPDESEFIAGALTLRQDPVYWRSLDGTTHGPLTECSLLVAGFARKALDFTTARIASVLLLWVELVSAWLIFRHFYKASVAGLLVLPLLAAHAFAHAWCFVAFCSEHVPDALLAVACWPLLTAWAPDGRGPPNLSKLFAAGVLLGAIPFAKLQAGPIAAVALAGGAWFAFISDSPNWRRHWHALAALVSGAAMIPAIIIGAVLASGIWSDFFRCYILDNIRYASTNKFPTEEVFTWSEAPRMLVELGKRADGFNSFFLWLLGFGMCGLLIFPWLTRWHRRVAGFAIVLVLAAIWAAMAPGRPYMHYLQLVIFPAGLFGGLITGAILHDFSSKTFPRVPTRVVPALVLGAFLSCAVAPQIWWRAREAQPFIGQYTATRGALARSPVSAEILQHANPGERLGIWGWMPVYWVETGMTQATRDGDDSRQIEPHEDQDYFRARYFRDFLRTRPPVFIDAVGTGNFLYENRPKCAHETFAELRDYIANNYRLIGDVEGTRIYVRNDRR